MKKTRLKKFDKLPEHIKQEVIQLRRQGRTFEYLENYLEEKYGIEISYKSLWNWFKDKQDMFDIALMFGETLENGELLSATKGLSFALVGIYQQLIYVLDNVSKTADIDSLEKHLSIIKDAMNTLSNFMRATAYTEKTQTELEDKYSKMFESFLEKATKEAKERFKDNPELANNVVEIIKKSL